MIYQGLQPKNQANWIIMGIDLIVILALWALGIMLIQESDSPEDQFLEGKGLAGLAMICLGFWLTMNIITPVLPERFVQQIQEITVPVRQKDLTPIAISDGKKVTFEVSDTEFEPEKWKALLELTAKGNKGELELPPGVDSGLIFYKFKDGQTLAARFKK